MNNKAHKKLVWLVAIAAIGVAVVLLLLWTGVGESVKRQSARLFEYEYIPNQNVDIDRCEAAGMADSIYKDFRKKYRFHYQIVGMASFSDSSRMILLSDIPPHFEMDSIAPIFAEFTHKTEQRKHPIGYDGYVTDVLILLGNATQENCNRLIRRLNRGLFFSEYKPTVMKLPAEEKRRYFAKENIDYQITLEEFNTWFMEEGEGFIHLDDTNTVLTISDIFAKKARGVFFSKQPGFVAWALAKNADLLGYGQGARTPVDGQGARAPVDGQGARTPVDGQGARTPVDGQGARTPNDGQDALAPIRQFTLDADLILGALADSSTLVIIGRERQSPLYELPPLQIESILLLASTTEKELSQSLDINDLMAGKMNNGRDWCPTYLSRELENTEFGDLMTITDVLLKDWSEHGTIQEGYYRYPEPGYYPFDKPLFKKLGLNELVYNWNTAGAMYAIDREGYTIYTLGRTGSLPVSYFNSQERSQSIGYRYESQAYHYFATLGNTDLARVVQYTALYQLFIDNNITYSGNTFPSFPKNKPFLLYKPSADLLTLLRQLSEEEIGTLADSLSQRSFVNYQKEHLDKQLRENEQKHNITYSEEHIDAIYRNVHRDTKAGIGRSLQEVKNMLCGLSEEQFKQLARYLSYPRGVKIRDKESYNTMLRGRRVNMLMREVGKNNLDLLGMDLKDVKNWYAANLKGNAGRYMKTSSLIITYADLLTTGGHNLSSRISRVSSMTNYKRNRGNYTPVDYDRPAAPAASDDRPASPPKVGSVPTAVKPSGKKVSANPKATSKGKPSGQRATGVRPRSSVISSAPRRSRGL
ncbi:MAG: hypothetical protein IKO67_03715 [Bacteroidaceae bacterium]|nr:hypothetical protein [Bacteroidaceae bacterium]